MFNVAVKYEEMIWRKCILSTNTIKRAKAQVLFRVKLGLLDAKICEKKEEQLLKNSSKKY